MGPLGGVRVLEWATGLAGPYAAQLLAGYGAEVVKVEHPGRGDFVRTWGPMHGEQSLYFASVNRGKRGVGLDLRHPLGREAGLRLAAQSDVVIESFRPGTLERWGLAPENLMAANPSLVLCRISGFGQSGPDRDLTAFDPIIQAMSGLMSVNGDPDGEATRVPIPISDILAGIQAALAVAAALHEPPPRAGRVLDVALFDALASCLFPYNLFHMGGVGTVPRMGNRHPSLAPYEVLSSSDGPFVVAVANENQWRRFCDVLEQTQLADDERFRTNPLRVRNRADLLALLAPALRRRTAREWVGRLRAAGVPCGPIQTVAEAFDSEQVRARNLAVPVPWAGEGLHLPGFAVRLGDGGGGVGAAPPGIGEHTEEVLGEVGFDTTQIEALRAKGVVA